MEGSVEVKQKGECPFCGSRPVCATTSLVYRPAFIRAMRQGEPQAASKGASIAPGSPKVAPRAGLPLSARIPNHFLPPGLEHRRSLFQHKTSHARFDRA